MKKILSAIAIVLLLVCVLASCNIQLTPNESATPTIEISEDGYWVINGEKTDVKAQGEKGDKGDRGELGIPGEKGEDGKTPTFKVEENILYVSYDEGANWISLGNIGGTDGKDGENGADGKDGIGIQSVEFDEQGRLVLILSDGTKLPPIEIPKNDTRQPSFEGKTVSILGDSISTFGGVANNSSYNPTLGANISFYPTNNVTTKTETWWQQVIDTLGMKLCVNNSSGGGRVLSDESFNGTSIRNVAAYKNRCVNLHNSIGETPDVILIFLGTNDFSYHLDTANCPDCKSLKTVCVDPVTCNGTNICSACRAKSGQGASYCAQDLGTASIVYTDLITENPDGTFTYSTPKTTMEAYAVMLHKIKQKYPDAQIFCMGLLARRNPDIAGGYHDHGQPTVYNNEMKKVVEHFNATYIDLEKCGIDEDASGFDKYIYDKAVHPNASGMDKIAQAVVSAMLREEVYEVSSNLINMSLEGDSIVLPGNPYMAKLIPTCDYFDITVKVTMGGKDITNSVYADGIINIPTVTGDVTITAVANSVVWSVGAINSTNGENADGAYWKIRIRTDYIAVTSDITISVLGGDAEFCVFYYDSSLNYIQPYDDYTTSNIVVSPAKCAYIRIMARYKPNTEKILTADYGNNIDVVFN